MTVHQFGVVYFTGSYIMNINKAVAILAKFFQMDAEVFTKLARHHKETVVAWGKQVAATGSRGSYQLTRDQHAFLIGEIKGF